MKMCCGVHIVNLSSVVNKGKSQCVRVVDGSIPDVMLPHRVVPFSLHTLCTQTNAEVPKCQHDSTTMSLLEATSLLITLIVVWLTH